MDPVRLCYGYSDKDEALREKLDTHLASLRRLGVITDRHRRRIMPGKEWTAESERQFGDAEIILLLISADFDSEYCDSKEAQQALLLHQAGAVSLIPILIRPTVWPTSPFYALAALPKTGKSITEWRNRDKAWVDVVQGIKAVAELRSKQHRRGVTYEIRLAGQITEVDRQRAIGLLSQIQELSQDTKLTMRAVAEGSVRLIMRGSLTGFVRVARLVTVGNLQELAGLKVQKVQLLRSAFLVTLAVWLGSLAEMVGARRRGYFPAVKTWAVAVLTALSVAGLTLVLWAVPHTLPRQVPAPPTQLNGVGKAADRVPAADLHPEDLHLSPSVPVNPQLPPASKETPDPAAPLDTVHSPVSADRRLPKPDTNANDLKLRKDPMIVEHAKTPPHPAADLAHSDESKGASTDSATTAQRAPVPREVPRGEQSPDALPSNAKSEGPRAHELPPSPTSNVEPAPTAGAASATDDLAAAMPKASDQRAQNPTPSTSHDAKQPSAELVSAPTTSALPAAKQPGTIVATTPTPIQPAGRGWKDWISQLGGVQTTLANAELERKNGALELAFSHCSKAFTQLTATNLKDYGWNRDSHSKTLWVGARDTLQARAYLCLSWHYAYHYHAQKCQNLLSFQTDLAEECERIKQNQASHLKLASDLQTKLKQDLDVNGLRNANTDVSIWIVENTKEMARLEDYFIRGAPSGLLPSP